MGKNSEAAAFFIKGIIELTPVFQKYNSAFLNLMSNLLGDYINALKACNQEPDMEHLRPTLEVFARLEQNKDKE